MNKKEPAVTVGAITAVVTAVLSLLAVFGLSIDTKTSAAILGVVAAVAPLVAGYLTRGKVVPKETHDEQIAVALATPVPDSRPIHEPDASGDLR